MIKIRLQRQMHTPQGPLELDINLEFNQGEFIALYGPSGAGKTTVLRMLAGLIQPDEGEIRLGDEVWFDHSRGINKSIQERQVGFVFQEQALFPNMSIYENIVFACRDKKAQASVAQWIELVGLKGLENQKPQQLSGGQKQRVGLLRAIIAKPKLLLLDEPLSDLDQEARLNLQEIIIKLYQQTGITTLLVSHDVSEVFRLSKKMFVLKQGKIIKSGTPHEIFIQGDLSGKFKFTGHILEMNKDGVLNILTLMIGNNITRVVATDEEIAGLKPGDQIVVAAKAFNPLIFKI